MAGFNWVNTRSLTPRSYVCGYCGRVSGSNRGYANDVLAGPFVYIYICSFCDQPTYFIGNQQTPGVSYGNPVMSVPQVIDSLYTEARNCMAVSAFTSAVLACRKLLMNIGVAEGAVPGKPFIFYVEYLSNNGYVPPNGKGWVDHIRKKGNEATHEIQLMNKADAEELISFIEMLLKFIYEFPSKIPAPLP